jgi:predicted deoxyguanosinetriphosphate triphosphohydrolase
VRVEEARWPNSKSQIVGVDVGDFFRTRITHSLECAQIGRAIAEAVAEGGDVTGVVDDPRHLPDVVEAACLAHDLGHPPFGHNGEKALQGCMRVRNESLFEGNAQSFRVVTYVEAKHHGYTKHGRGTRPVGLNLTRATLRSLFKYPWPETKKMLEDEKAKFGVYDDPDDRAYFEWVWNGVPPKTSVLSAQIMDTADDVAYAVHDLEDGVWGGMIPLYELLTENERVVGKLEEHLQRQKTSPFPNADALGTTLRELFESPRLDYLRGGLLFLPLDLSHERALLAACAIASAMMPALGRKSSALAESARITSEGVADMSTIAGGCA